jgi:hypothetical protein
MEMSYDTNYYHQRRPGFGWGDIISQNFLKEYQTPFTMFNKWSYPVQDKGILKGFLKDPQIHHPRIFSRLLRTITIVTPDEEKKISALFNTGVNVFILSQETSQIYNIFIMKQEKPFTLLGFSGHEETSFRKYFVPLWNIKIEDYISVRGEVLSRL